MKITKLAVVTAAATLGALLSAGSASAAGESITDPDEPSIGQGADIKSAQFTFTNNGYIGRIETYGKPKATDDFNLTINITTTTPQLALSAVVLDGELAGALTKQSDDPNPRYEVAAHAYQDEADYCDTGADTATAVAGRIYVIKGAWSGVHLPRPIDVNENIGWYATTENANGPIDNTQTSTVAALNPTPVTTQLNTPQYSFLESDHIGWAAGNLSGGDVSREQVALQYKPPTKLDFISPAPGGGVNGVYLAPGDIGCDDNAAAGAGGYAAYFLSDKNATIRPIYYGSDLKTPVTGAEKTITVNKVVTMDLKPNVTVNKGGVVRFHGVVRPAGPNGHVLIQYRKGGAGSPWYYATSRPLQYKGDQFYTWDWKPTSAQKVTFRVTWSEGATKANGGNTPGISNYSTITVK